MKIILAILALWAIPWKLYAVWAAVKNGSKKWFVALILLNTFGILEIIYVFYILKKSWTEVRSDIVRQYHEIKNRKKKEE